jgi:O-antigen/teichoic acid export membrane protein
MSKPHNPVLSHRIASAGSLSIIGKFAGRGFDLIALAILSRLLSPADFGLTAIAMTTVTIAETVTALPLMQALVRVAEPTEDMYATAFTLAFIRGVVLAVVLSTAAVAMSYIYHEPRLIALICALSLAPILRGIVSPRMVVYMQQLDFRRDAGMEVAGKAIALLISASLALTTHSYWAIASATISTPLIMVVLSYIFAPYIPRFCLSQWAIFRSFVSWNSLSQLLAAMNWQMDRLLLGYFVPQATLGRYTMASDLVGVPIQAIVVPLGNPLLAAYSIRKDDHHSILAASYLKASNAILAVGGPILLGLSLLASPLVQLVLGPSWEETGNMLQWLALFSVFVLPVYHVGGLALARGQARMMAWRMIGEFLVAMPALFFGSKYFGVPGVITARAFTMLFILGIGMEAVRRLVMCSFVSQINALRRTIFALTAMAAVVFLLRKFIATDTPLALALGLGAVAATGAITYVVALGILWSLEGRPGGIERVVWEKMVSFWEILKRKYESA